MGIYTENKENKLKIIGRPEECCVIVATRFIQAVGTLNTHHKKMIQ